MKPGLSRAIPMGILGFLFGSLLVVIIRALQGLTPIYDPGPGIILSTVTTAAFFLWGIGAFDPRMSVHGEGHDEAHEAEEAEVVKPTSLLAGSIWQIATLLIVVLVPLMAFAAFGGLTLKTTSDPFASPTAVGYYPIEIGGTEIMVSQLVVFAAFVIFMFVSLAAAAGVIGFIIYSLSRGVTETSAAGGAGAPALTARAGEPAQARSTGDTIKTILLFVVVFLVLYLLFYYVLIGLVMPNPPELLFILSVVNALIFTLLILRPYLVLSTIGRVAGWVARLLRRLPLIFQR